MKQQIAQLKQLRDDMTKEFQLTTRRATKLFKEKQQLASALEEEKRHNTESIAQMQAQTLASTPAKAQAPNLGSCNERGLGTGVDRGARGHGEGLHSVLGPRAHGRPQR